MTAAEPDDGPRFIVGIGASAGGLEALASLIAGLTLDSMGFVVVQHLSPDHESSLPALLSRSSRSVSVVTAADGMKVAANRVYVIPPNADLGILGGRLQVLSPPALPHPRLPIDFFLRSLAADQGTHAVGIVLSGTGSDGTLGLKSVREAGGLTFAQEPTSARYDSMPRAAIDSGWVDFVGTPAAIADELMQLGTHPYHAAARRHGAPALGQDGIAKALLLIRATFGNDLTYYKPTTIERRLERRMALHKIEHIDDYLKLVQSNAQELRALYKDMLIGVTSFFRDAESFDALRTMVFPRLTEGKKPGTSIRIWVPACSTGEEPYSIAIALVEYLEEKNLDLRVRMFATDVDDDAVQKARRGRYPQSIALDVSPERLQRFFTPEDECFCISRRIRDLVVFSTHDAAKDPPFSRIDLVSCRNLLIYLQPVMQKKILRIFHYALNPSGFLLLGTSESAGDAPELFSVVDAKSKLYLAKTTALAAPVDLGVGISASVPPRTIQPGGRMRPIVNLAQLAERKILDLFGPPGVVINENFDALHFRGRTSPFLEPAPGAATLNILRLARPEIHADLRRAVQRALDEERHVTLTSQISDGGGLRPFLLEVVPLTDPDTRTRCLLVLFHPPAEESRAPSPPSTGGDDPHTVELERELLLTKDYLQNAIEEVEGTNEELQSANEELQSANEELQSTNEELETSKEELQSANEELTTVNEELQHRMIELQQTYDDLVNVMNGVDNAVIIVGMDLRIRRFTSAAERIIGLAPGDVGREIARIETFVGGLSLRELATRVIDVLSTIEREVQCSDGRWYQLRISPYKTAEHSIRGAVFVLSDIDLRKRSVKLGRDIADYANQFLAAVAHPLLIVDGQKRVHWANAAYYSSFNVVQEEVVGQRLSDLDGGRWSTPELAARLDQVLGLGTGFRDLTMTGASEGRSCRIRVSGSRLPSTGEEQTLSLLSFILDVPAAN
jgi:two-component system, chemotaxis family, CheB/CheR fusion protein